MIYFFHLEKQAKIYALQTNHKLEKVDIEKLIWLFGEAELIENTEITALFIGPRKEMITPWSTNAVEITQNMALPPIIRIEEFFFTKTEKPQFDPMLQALYNKLDQNIFTIDRAPEPIRFIDNISEYNKTEGLALSSDEILYLENLSRKIDRKLTDSEVFGFSQVNSEHCRHKIFNGQFVINGQEKPDSLFSLIKKTSSENPNFIVSAYKDNVAFLQASEVEIFAPANQDIPDYFEIKKVQAVFALKAETHNFPTTVEPFNGAATGLGGEIRDRMAGGIGSFPLAGTAVYMTSYPRLEADRSWEQKFGERKWLYQTPADILMKASNGASDFGNKFGQPLICGSLLTFEHLENGVKTGFDKVIMLAGGIGFAKAADALKNSPHIGDKVVILGGDNYRIGMGGGAVSSVATGEYKSKIELNAVQRANPEMQKRVYNAIRALAESQSNPIVSIHDHGAGGHLNCLSELVEEIGGKIDITKLPIGDTTLSDKEIIGNESQERMGLILRENDIEFLKRVADRERAPMYVVGQTTGDNRFTFENSTTHKKPIDLELIDFFGKPPKTVLVDNEITVTYSELSYSESEFLNYLKNVLQLEAVACKDWLTNKVDRSVMGRSAMQQTAGKIQLPLNNLGISALDYSGVRGVATSIGHAPAAALVDVVAGSKLAIAEALTNIIWAPLTYQIKGVSLSANWMWPAKNAGEDARLYNAVQAVSQFAIELGINIPTGKDSLSMTQKYPNGDVVFSPGTVIISAAAEVCDFRKAISPPLQNVENNCLIYIDFSKDDFHLGGSSFAQQLNCLGKLVPSVQNNDYFKRAFNAVQTLISDEKILAGHDISAGGMITTLLEMIFTDNSIGIQIDITSFSETDYIKVLFSEKPAIIIQVEEKDFVTSFLSQQAIDFHIIGNSIPERKIELKHAKGIEILDPNSLRDIWFKTSFLFEKLQAGENHANKRFANYKSQEINYIFRKDFSGSLAEFGISESRKSSGIKAAIIREKGVNGDREMAYSMYLAGFDVKDVHITDLIYGRETLDDIHFVVYVGGFSNSDVLGSAKGWAGAFLYNEKAKTALENFYKRTNTLSLGVCNGCQLMTELGLIYPDHEKHPKMLHNESGKFESAFLTIDIQQNNSIMLKTMQGNRLGIWVAHGEGKFSMPYSEESYNITAKYSYTEYPGNPNGSDYCTAAIHSHDGRHLAMMPHLERAIFPWQWAFYPKSGKQHTVSPWIEAFVNARNWIAENK